MPTDPLRLSRRRLLASMVGVAAAAAVGRLTWLEGALPASARGDRLCLGAAVFEATQHGDESLVLPALDDWRKRTGFYPAVLPLWSPFDTDLPAPRGGRFPADWLLAGMRERGVEPAIFAHSADERGWRTHGYEAILRGDRDEAIERWGLAAAAYGHRLVLRWDQEMNGSFPWSERDPAEYIRVFRRVSDRIRRVAGASNVQLHFCPSLRQQRDSLDVMESYYPGDEWCQVVGFDGYSRSERWEPLAEQWGPMLRRLARMTDRPVLVGEFGRRVDLPDRAGWLASLADVEGVDAAVYFDMDLPFFEWPGHHWLMDRPMRAVYADLPRCRRIEREPAQLPSPSPEPSPQPSPSAGPSPQPSPSAGPSTGPSPTGLPSGAPSTTPTAPPSTTPSVDGLP